MAQLAFGRPCKNCQTLCTFSGNAFDGEYSVKCPCCGSTQTAPNPSGYVPPAPEPVVVPEPTIDPVPTPEFEHTFAVDPAVFEPTPAVAPTEENLTHEGA